MSNIEIIKTLLNVMECSSVTDEAIRKAVLALLEKEEEPKKVKTAPAKKEPAKEEPKPKKKPGRKPIDWPKAEACRNAGWSIPMIADELNVSDQTVRNHFKMLEV